MKKLAAVALGKKLAAKLKKRLGKDKLSEHMRNVALSPIADAAEKCRRFDAGLLAQEVFA
jgi:hypothetical protein